MDKYPEITFAIENKFKKLNKDKLIPWVFLNTGKMALIEDFYGHTIQYRGVGFEGSPREVFWNSGFIEPFLEDIFGWAFELSLDYANKRNQDRENLILHTYQCLINGVVLTYNRMQNIDQRLRGRGFPNKVLKRDISKEIEKMRGKLNEYRDSALAPLKITNEQAISNSLSETVELKPEFFGFSLDLKKLWKWCLSRFSREDKNKQAKANKSIIKNKKKCAFYNKWWFKLLLAPILVGLFLLYLQSNSSNWRKNNLNSSPSNEIKKSNISGDVVGRDKIIYQPVMSISADQADIEKQNKIKISKIKIRRIIDDLSSGVNEIKKEYFKKIERIANDFSSRNMSQGGGYIKVQMDFAVSTKEKIEKLVTKAHRDIEDVLLKYFNITNLTEMGEFKEEDKTLSEFEKNSIPALYKQLEGIVKSQEAKSLETVQITKNFKL